MMDTRRAPANSQELRNGPGTENSLEAPPIVAPLVAGEHFRHG